MILPISSASCCCSAAWPASPSPTIISSAYRIEHGEYYVLLLFSITGMMLMSMSADLIIVFLALELLSIPLYVLAGIACPA